MMESKNSLQIKSLLLSHHHSTCALVSEILENNNFNFNKVQTLRYIILIKMKCFMSYQY